MRILIIGASGFIGRHLVRRLNRSVRFSLSCTFHEGSPGLDSNTWLRADVTDPGGLGQAFRAVRPEVVVNLSALADVGTAEREPARATAINADGTSHIARLCHQHGAKLVQMSTEYVFNGQRGYYREDEPPDPATQYGRTKAEGESALARLCMQWCILRTSIVYGWPEPGRRNFAPQLIASLREGVSYHAPTHHYRTPVYVEHLVEAIEELSTGDHQGIFHVAGRDWVSMYEFASAIAREFGLDPSLVVPPYAAGDAAGSEARFPADATADDLLGLDCNRSMDALRLDYVGLPEGISALKAAAPPF